jgi:hypothetical protein
MSGAKFAETKRRYDVVARERGNKVFPGLKPPAPDPSDEAEYNIISPHFDFLIGKNLLGKSRMRILSHDITGKGTNVVDVLEGDGIYVQLTRERGDVFVRVGPGTTPEQLLNLKLLRLLVLKRNPTEDVDLAEDARFFRARYADVKDMLSPPMFTATKHRFNEFRRERIKLSP